MTRYRGQQTPVQRNLPRLQASFDFLVVIGRMKPPRYSYLLCATDRSGSTWLTHGLSSLGTAGRPREYFSHKFRTPSGLAWSTSSFDAVLDEVFRAGSTPNGVFGSKLMWWQLQQLHRHARPRTEYAGIGLGELMPRVLPGARYIYLTRRDRLRQAISHWKAQQSGVWHHQRNLPRAPQLGLSFDFHEIEHRLRLLEECEAQWEHYFKQIGAAPLRLTYEEMLNDFTGVLAHIVDYLGIEAPSPLAEPLDAPVRLPDTVADAWIRRYEARTALGNRLPPRLRRLFDALLRIEGDVQRIPLSFLRRAYFGTMKVPGLRPLVEHMLEVADADNSRGTQTLSR